MMPKDSRKVEYKIEMPFCRATRPMNLSKWIPKICEL